MDVKSFPRHAKVWTLEFPQLNVVKPEATVPFQAIARGVYVTSPRR